MHSPAIIFNGACDLGVPASPTLSIPTKGPLLLREVPYHALRCFLDIQPLRNLVTYDYVEFQPGSYPNVIIGPHCTGLSQVLG
ncbi:hypothetical protein BT96DRAFT_415547 [Gymnopus androsaceus JB14]|uniref:Uncharacterized protein n=1 Tax=Gymnopus androsaceus JB14 TaxID=1447944 RepID=A0A6A4GVA0_9AGAR|nr:hypothetical protein BT96DRAFT_415547 [Gymnopus androsaceus JB14]